jgi:hypothetical protein
MAEAMDGVRKWAATVSAALAVSLVVGGLALHSDVRSDGVKLEAVGLLAQATDNRERTLESAVQGVDAKLDGLARDVDKLGEALQRQSVTAAEDRARILQELGRLQGASDGRATDGRTERR